MSPQKTTIMVLKVDLQCACCYRKVKKVLCKFPQIRDNVFDEKANTVTITVVCCNPEKIRAKICCNGGKAIKSIEIKDPPKPNEKPKDHEKPNEPDEKPNELKKQKEKIPIKPTEKNPPPTSKPTIPVNGYPSPVYVPIFPVPVCCGECFNGHGGGPCHSGFGRPVPPPPGPSCCEECSHGQGGGPCHSGFGRPVPPPPRPSCCEECSHGQGGGPCHRGFGRPVPPPPGPCYDGYGYGGNRVCYVTSCDYLSEENPSGCSIM